MPDTRSIADAIKSYDIPVGELHSKLGIEGTYSDSGFWFGKDSEEFRKYMASKSHDYFIRTIVDADEPENPSQKTKAMHTATRTWVVTPLMLAEAVGAKGILFHFQKTKDAYNIMFVHMPGK